MWKIPPKSLFWFCWSFLQSFDEITVSRPREKNDFFMISGILWLISKISGILKQALKCNIICRPCKFLSIWDLIWCNNIIMRSHMRWDEVGEMWCGSRIRNSGSTLGSDMTGTDDLCTIQFARCSWLLSNRVEQLKTVLESFLLKFWRFEVSEAFFL